MTWKIYTTDWPLNSRDEVFEDTGFVTKRIAQMIFEVRRAQNPNKTLWLDR